MEEQHRLPFLVASDEEGNIFDIPELLMTGMEGNTPVLPEEEELIPLPYGSDLFLLPGCLPVGWDPRENRARGISEYRGKKIHAVAAFMAPAYIQHYLASFEKSAEAPVLPLYSYTAVGFRDGSFVVPASRIDEDIRQDLRFVDLKKIRKQAKKVKKMYRGNRLVEHLVDNCALCYGCPAARNFVMGRWECPVPTSPGCNAACVGCISEQPSESGMNPAQERIGFTPRAEEIVEFTLPHLNSAPRPVISFGQGCEGEPLLAADVIEESIREIRRRTDRGIININTNASLPDKVERLCKAGLDSIRISMNSAQEEFYRAYYNPRSYGFEDVLESMKIARTFRIWVSINYFIFPGFTDHPSEISALEMLLRDPGIDMIQTRNTNIDPYLYMERLGFDRLPKTFIGIDAWLGHVKTLFPEVKLGYFNPPREAMRL